MARREVIQAVVFAVIHGCYALLAAWFFLSDGQPAHSKGQVQAASVVRFARTVEALDPNTVFDRVNEARQQAGLAPLVRDAALAEAALARAGDMAQHGYYDHRSPDGSYYFDLLEGTGYEDRYSCENLNLDFAADEELPVRRWLESRAGHRQCLLNEDTDRAGYAVAALRFSADDPPAYVVVAIHADGSD